MSFEDVTLLGSVVNCFDSKRIPLSTRERESKQGHYPYYGAAGIIDHVNKPIFSGLYLLMGEDGSVVEENGTPVLQLVSGEFWVNNHAHVLQGETDLETRFIYYALKNTNIQGFVTGAVQPKLNQANMNNIPIYFPEKSARVRIVETLGCLDEKIDLNRQTNATLEAIAQAIFKEWFVDFNYPGATGEMVESEFGLIPKGWHVVQIGELIGSAYGGDWGTDTKQNEDDILCGVIRGTDFENLSQGFVNAIPRRYIKQKSFVKRRLREGDIIIEISGGSKNQATGRNLWVSSEILALFDRPIVPTSFCRLIRPENIDISLFLGTFLSGFYKAGGTWDYQLQSTGISNFQFNDFSSRQKIVLPDTQALHNFSQIAYLIFSLRGENSKNNYSLTSTLNLLLPKLLRGSLSSFEISEIQSHKE